MNLDSSYEALPLLIDVRPPWCQHGTGGNRGKKVRIANPETHGGLSPYSRVVASNATSTPSIPMPCSWNVSAARSCRSQPRQAYCNIFDQSSRQQQYPDQE